MGLLRVASAMSLCALAFAVQAEQLPIEVLSAVKHTLNSGCLPGFYTKCDVVFIPTMGGRLLAQLQVSEASVGNRQARHHTLPKLPPVQTQPPTESTKLDRN